nr:hypothetical protein [Tanacetum cinerariifolium]
MQQTINELTAFYTILQRQHSKLLAKFQAQEVEINRLKERVKLLEDREGVAIEGYGDDAPIKGRKLNEGEAAAERGSDDTEEMATILTSMDAATVLASRAAEVPTGSRSIPTAGPPAAEVPTGNDVVPTASPVFATATMVTPYRRRKGKEVMVESETPKKQKVQEQIDAQEYHQFASEIPIERRIELISRLVKGITFEEVKAKFNSVSKQMEDFILMGSKEEAERIKRKGLSLKQESAKKQKTLEEVTEEAKSSDEVPDEKVKEMMQLVPIEEVYAEALQVKHPIIDWKILVKETLNNKPPTNDKEMELWVELSRLYEPDDEDQLWTHTKNLMHALVEWKLYDSCGVHHVTSKDKEIFMLVEKDYPLRKGLALVMISYKLQVQNYLRMANDLILKIYKIKTEIQAEQVLTETKETYAEKNKSNSLEGLKKRRRLKHRELNLVMENKKITLVTRIGNSSNVLDKSKLWHSRLGHINKKHIAQLQKNGVLESFNVKSDDVCESCILGKMTKSPFIGSCEKGKRPSLGHIKIRGCEVFVRREAQDKLEDRSEKCLFVSYLKDSFGYLFYIPKDNVVFVVRRGVFFEREMIFKEDSGKDKISDSILSELDELANYKEAMTIGCKWIFKKKTDIDGKVQTYKARIMLAIAAFHKYEIWHMHVKIAFLNKKLTEDVFMEQPEGFKNAKSKDESCIYVKVSGSVVVFLVLFVDDILLIGSDIPALQSVKDWLGKCFAMNDLGDATSILGIKIYKDRSKRLIGLSHDTYLDKILKRFKIENSKKWDLPLHHGIKIRNRMPTLLMGDILASSLLFHMRRDYELLNHQMLQSLIEKVNGMQGNKQLLYGDGETDVEPISDADPSNLR